MYLTGGAVLEDGDGIDIVQLYNPRIQTWIEMRPMKIPRSGSGACVLDGKIYVIGYFFIISKYNISELYIYLYKQILF